MGLAQLLPMSDHTPRITTARLVGWLAALLVSTAACGCTADDTRPPATPHASMLVSDGPAPYYRLESGQHDAIVRVSSFGISTAPSGGVENVAHVRFQVSNRGASPLFLDPGHLRISRTDHLRPEALPLFACNGQPYWAIGPGEESSYDALARMPIHHRREEITLVRVAWAYKAPEDFGYETQQTIFLPVRGTPQYGSTLALRAAVSPLFYRAEEAPPQLTDLSVSSIR